MASATYRPLFRFVHHGSSTHGDEEATRRKARRRQCRWYRNRRRQKQQRLWREQWAAQYNLVEEELGWWQGLQQEAGPGWVPEDAQNVGGQFATARDLLMAEGQHAEWVQLDEASDQWIGLSDEEMRAISQPPYFQHMPPNNNNSADERKCPICLVDEIPEGDEIIITGCRHRFCAACLWPHIVHNRACPTCRHHVITGEKLPEMPDASENTHDEEEEGRSTEGSSDSDGEDADSQMPSTSTAPPPLRNIHVKRMKKKDRESGWGTYNRSKMEDWSSDGSFDEIIPN